jgi:hypothetical protein
MEATRHAGRVVIAGSILLGCGDGESIEISRSEPVDRVRRAAVVTQEWVLPVPVGLSPADLTLGAGSIKVNDRARIMGGDIAAMGQTDVTELGVETEVGNVWTRSLASPSAFLRRSIVAGFVKAAGTRF